MHIVYGIHAVKSVLMCTPHRILELYMTEASATTRAFKEMAVLADQQGVKIQITSKHTLDKWAKNGGHQNILAKCRPIEWLSEKQLVQGLQYVQNQTPLSPPFLLLLEGIQDPHNLGACLRSANAAGVDYVILSQSNSCAITSVVEKVASGAVSDLKMITVSNMARCIDQLQALGIWVVGLTDQAAESLYEIDCSGPIALVMGAEGSGLRALTKKKCDYLALLPMKGVVESLNVSVATGVSLYEVVRQRRQ